MSVKAKKLSEEVKFQRQLDKLDDESHYLKLQNNIAIHKDMENRFSKYDDDVSVGDMYQRKKKATKSKTKRAKKKKGCGCK
jgi:hypothetical protein